MAPVALNDLVSDIIELSRIEIGQLDIESISFDPESAIDGIVKSMLFRAEDKDLSLAFEQGNKLPHLIASDPAKIERILVSIISHAIDHTTSGRIHISTDFDSEKHLLEVSIEHTTDTANIAQINGIIEVEFHKFDGLRLKSYMIEIIRKAYRVWKYLVIRPP